MTSTPPVPQSTASDDVSARARRLRAAVEPIAGIVYFAPENHAEFEALGFGPGVGGDGYLTLAEVSGYYCSRAGCMGQVPGLVAVAAFGVFNPKLMVPAVERGWSIAGVDEVLAARERGRRRRAAPDRRGTRGARPGRPSCSARRGRRLRIRPVPVRRVAFAARAGLAVGRGVAARRLHPRAPGRLAHRRMDRGRARPCRGGPADRGVLRDAEQALPQRARVDAEDLDAGLDRLRASGLIDGDTGTLTGRGSAVREAIEVSTDIQQRSILDAIGDDLEELLTLHRAVGCGDLRERDLPDVHRAAAARMGADDRRRGLTSRSGNSRPSLQRPLDVRRSARCAPGSGGAAPSSRGRRGRTRRAG